MVYNPHIGNQMKYLPNSGIYGLSLTNQLLFFKQGIPGGSCQVVQQDIKLLKIFMICNLCSANYGCFSW